MENSLPPDNRQVDGDILGSDGGDSGRGKAEKILVEQHLESIKLTLTVLTLTFSGLGLLLTMWGIKSFAEVKEQVRAQVKFETEEFLEKDNSKLIVDTIEGDTVQKKFAAIVQDLAVKNLSPWNEKFDYLEKNYKQLNDDVQIKNEELERLSKTFRIQIVALQEKIGINPNQYKTHEENLAEKITSLQTQINSLGNSKLDERYKLSQKLYTHYQEIQKNSKLMKDFTLAEHINNAQNIIKVSNTYFDYGFKNNKPEIISVAKSIINDSRYALDLSTLRGEKNNVDYTLKLASYEIKLNQEIIGLNKALNLYRDIIPYLYDERYFNVYFKRLDTARKYQPEYLNSFTHKIINRYLILFGKDKLDKLLLNFPYLKDINMEKQDD